MTRRNEDDIHNYAGKLRRIKQRLEEMPQGDVAVRFLEKLKLAGRKDGRIVYYADRLVLIMRLFNTKFVSPVILNDSTKNDCESILSEIISNESYKGETKKAYALSLLRLVHCKDR